MRKKAVFSIIRLFVGTICLSSHSKAFLLECRWEKHSRQGVGGIGDAVLAFPSKSKNSPSKRRMSIQNLDTEIVTVGADNVFSEIPYLAIITERGSCDSDEKFADALDSLHKSVSTNLVNLVSVRINIPSNEDSIDAPRKQRLVRVMIQQLLEWSKQYNNFVVVASSDWMDLALDAGSHGIHFKETHRHLIPLARRLRKHQNLIVGTSTHTVQSALEAYEKYGPIDYYFAGTCYETLSHPEKTGDDLEGPEFPFEAKLALYESILNSGDQNVVQIHRKDVTQQKTVIVPPVFAIGGLDASNCHVPLRVLNPMQIKDVQRQGPPRVDGIATISAVLQAPDPSMAVIQIHNKMKEALL